MYHPKNDFEDIRLLNPSNFGMRGSSNEYARDIIILADSSRLGGCNLSEGQERLAPEVHLLLCGMTQDVLFFSATICRPAM